MAKLDKQVEEELELRDPRVYELGYILVPQIKDEDLDKEIDAVRKIITDDGGLPISEGRATLMEIAYPMDKIVDNQRQTYTKGYFGWIKFDVTPEKLATIKAGLDKADTIIRFLLISTSREDTMVGKKIAPKFGGEGEGEKESRPSRKPKTEVAAEPIDEKELDKQIDDLVVEE